MLPLKQGTLTVASVFLLSACGLTAMQREAASRFSRASTTIGDFTASELPQLREAMISMNKTDVVIGGTRKYTELDKNFSASTVATRVKAAHALSSYGTLLMSLVTETQAEELKKASDDFVSSFKSVSGKRLSDDQLEALGHTVRQIGGWVVEYKKAKAVKSIVAQAQPDVDRLCSLLIDDFTTFGLHLSQEADATIIRLRADVDISLADEHTSFAERVVAVEGALLADQTEARLTLVDAQARSVLVALRTANADLARAMAEESFNMSDIQGLSRQVKELADSAKALSGR